MFRKNGITKKQSKSLKNVSEYVKDLFKMQADPVILNIPNFTILQFRDNIAQKNYHQLKYKRTLTLWIWYISIVLSIYLHFQTRCMTYSVFTPVLLHYRNFCAITISKEQNSVWPIPFFTNLDAFCYNYSKI